MSNISPIAERFMRYVKIDTQSDPDSTTYPSTEKQKEEAENYGDIEEANDADALIEKHTATLEERKRERNEITPRINSKNIDEAKIGRAHV